MNISFHIARRYFKSKKSTNIINLISKISVVGIMVSTMALIVVLSAFNGIEKIVVGLYTDFDTDLTIRSEKGKTFNQSFLDLDTLRNFEGVDGLSRALEEIVILRKGNKWVKAQMTGVDSSFLRMSHMENHLYEGDPSFNFEGLPVALFGVGLLQKLDTYVPRFANENSVLFNVPLREGKFRPGKNPLSTKHIYIGGSMNFNKEVNDEQVVVPFELANELLNYRGDISAVYLSVDPAYDNEDIKEALYKVLPKGFVVKTNFEKNELIFKTSKSERIIVIFILIFIFILSSFNLIASITMLYVEKRDNIKTLYSMGIDKEAMFKVFFYEGLLISFRGILLGILLGYTICVLQINYGFVKMPNSNGEFFPIALKWMDGLMIVVSALFLGVIASYLPSRYLFRKHDKIYFHQ
ncbi:lipoprotein-releasing system permease protein [Lishizhenia tianjinensis]|uniref:Lipoprotein-releasing system permease protein n=1 Tax=Lishizhenia tianjinensis TaxID=477690 RepID=A0A1I6ZU48_9FLAO|nr:FtsX-like permease family protein [Lishizhenia tianjinensis]SFT66191.1 lipoprotein-releasing system permease protein [Lishizhenia tianjinensis]